MVNNILVTQMNSSAIVLFRIYNCNHEVERTFLNVLSIIIAMTYFIRGKYAYS